MPGSGWGLVAVENLPQAPQKPHPQGTAGGQCWWAMTRPATDDTGDGRPGKARKRIEALLRDAWEVRPWLDGEGWCIRAPMDLDVWQAWRKVDKEWSELVARSITKAESQVFVDRGWQRD